MLPDLKLPSNRLPVEPLLEVLPQEYITTIGPQGKQEWLERGITFIDADKLAVKYGFHPVEIWGSLWTTDDIHEDVLRAGMTVVEAVKKVGRINMKDLIKAVDVPGDYVRYIIRWVEELGCISVTKEGPGRKVLQYERDFDE
jgi:hypothetical protein